MVLLNCVIVLVCYACVLCMCTLLNALNMTVVVVINIYEPANYGKEFFCRSDS